MDDLEHRLTARIAALEAAKIAAERHLRDVCVALGEVKALRTPEESPALSGDDVGEHGA